MTGIWRSITQALFRRVGQTNNRWTPIGVQEVKTVFISRPNHRLGNLLLITPLIQEVVESFPSAKITLFVKGSAALPIFEKYPSVVECIVLPRRPLKNMIPYVVGWLKIRRRYYDLAINAVADSSSGRLSVKFSRSNRKLYSDLSELKNDVENSGQHIAKAPVLSFRNDISKMGVLSTRRRIPKLSLMLSDDELSKGRELLNSLIDGRKKTICIFTYATGLKCLSSVWWNQFYWALKTEFPTYNILEILPVEKVSMISLQAPTFYSQNIRTIGSVLASAYVFIGADSGMMHLASSANVLTIGLFSVTSELAYGPYGNDSISLRTDQSSIPDLISRIKNAVGKRARLVNNRCRSTIGIV